MLSEGPVTQMVQSRVNKTANSNNLKCLNHMINGFIECSHYLKNEHLGIIHYYKLSVLPKGDENVLLKC